MNPDDRAKEEAMFERLLNLEAERTPVPDLRRMRSFKATQAHWQAQVVARRRRRRFSLAAVVATLGIGLGLISQWLPLQPSTLGQVASVSGELWLDRDTDHPVRLSAGSRGVEVRSETVLRTSDESLAALAWGTGHSIRLAPRTELELLDPQTLRVDAGAIYVDSGVIRRAAAITVVTDHGSFEEIGTRFIVRVEPAHARLQVREGMVVYSGDKDRPVPAGEQLTVDDTGAVERAAIGADDDLWNWTFAALGPQDLEGRTLDEFLTWMATENGWELSYESTELARRARRPTPTTNSQGRPAEHAREAVLRPKRLPPHDEGGRRRGETA
ncbi:MAG: FecR domain-containing protein, partial [Pseudomonadota bacterium]